MLQVMEMNKPPFKFKFVNMSVLKNNPAAEVKCHICGQGGHLYECAYCPRSYHIMCVPSTIDISPEGWRCMYHFCNECGTVVDYSESDLYHCEHCKTSYCSTHKNKAGFRMIGEDRDHVVLCKNCQDYSGLSEPPRKKLKVDSPGSADSFYKSDFYDSGEAQGLWRQQSDPGHLNARLNEDPSEEHFKSEPNSPPSTEITTPTSSGANVAENSIQSRISATASRNLVSALKDMMKITKKNQKIISQEIGISTTTLSGLVTGKRRTKGWKTLEYKLVKWILGQTVEKSASEHNAEYQRNVQTLQKIQRGFKHYLDDVYKNKESDKSSDRGSSSSPDPSQESPRNPKPQPQTPVSTKPNPIPMQTSEQSVNSNTNVLVQQPTAPAFFYPPLPEYFTDYSAPPHPIGDVNVNVRPNNQQVPYRSDEPMYERNYDEEQLRQFSATLPNQAQGMPAVSVPMEYMHERYEVQRGYIAYPQEYINTTDPHPHAYGAAPNMYRPMIQYPPYFMPQQVPGMAPNLINLQPAQQQPMNVSTNYGNPASNVNYSASNVNQLNEEVPQDYED